MIWILSTERAFVFSTFIREILKGRNLVGYAHEWVLRYPSVGRMAVNIVRRKRGSVQTFLGYLESVKFLRVSDPEVALERLRGGDATRICDDFVEYLPGQIA